MGAGASVSAASTEKTVPVDPLKFMWTGPPLSIAMFDCADTPATQATAHNPAQRSQQFMGEVCRGMQRLISFIDPLYSPVHVESLSGGGLNILTGFSRAIVGEKLSLTDL